MVLGLTAAVAAVVFSFVFGMVYYHPKVLGKLWAKEAGVTPNNKKNAMMKGTVLSIIGTLVLAYVLSMFLTYAGATTPTMGATVGAWAWLGFIATTTLGKIAWEGKSVKLYVIKNVYNLINFAVIGALLVYLA